MRITAFAKGLFSLVDSLEMGKGLSDLSDVMVGTVELSDLLALSRMREQFNSVTGPSATPQILFTVPDDKVWRLRAWGAQVASGAGSTVASGYLGVRLSPNVPINTHGAPLTDNFTLAVSSSVEVVARGLPLWLPPGANLIAWMVMPGAAAAVASQVLYEEIDA